MAAARIELQTDFDDLTLLAWIARGGFLSRLIQIYLCCARNALLSYASLVLRQQSREPQSPCVAETARLGGLQHVSNTKLANQHVQRTGREARVTRNFRRQSDWCRWESINGT